MRVGDLKLCITELTCMYTGHRAGEIGGGGCVAIYQPSAVWIWIGYMRLYFTATLFFPLFLFALESLNWCLRTVMMSNIQT